MGLVHLPSIQDYFKDPRNTEVFCVPAIWRTISFNQISGIVQALHYNVDFVIEKINFNFKKYYILKKCPIVDEAMIPFKYCLRNQTTCPWKTSCYRD